MDKVVIVGGTGLLGSMITKASLEGGHQTVVVTRALSERNKNQIDSFLEQGAEIEFANADDIQTMTMIFKDADAVICTIAGEVNVLQALEYPLLEAARAAEVKRFLPNEFGLDTLRIPVGTGALFDEKKAFRNKLKDSEVPFTAIFNGGIFDYLLPNLREYDAITTFGDLRDVPYYTHAREDIGAITIKAALDPRCENEYVHLKYNLVTQGEVLEILFANFPDYDFPRAHMSKEEILDGTHEVKTAIWIDGHCGLADPSCLDPRDLYPYYEFRSAAGALADPEFVFGERSIP